MAHEAETEKVLTDAKTVRNIKNQKGKWVQKAKRFLTFGERQEREDQIAQMRTQLRQPDWVKAALPGETTANLNKGIRNIQEDLEENAPPSDLSASTKAALFKRQRELRDKISQGMLTHEEMRRNPPGAVDRHRRWERSNKEAILEYKNICRLLEPESDAKDLASIETFRPHGNFAYNANAQIAGHMAYSGIPDENWEKTFGKGKLAELEKQAERERRLDAAQKAKETREANIAAEKEKQRLAQLEADARRAAETPGPVVDDGLTDVELTDDLL